MDFFLWYVKSDKTQQKSHHPFHAMPYTVQCTAMIYTVKNAGGFMLSAPKSKTSAKREQKVLCYSLTPKTSKFIQEIDPKTRIRTNYFCKISKRVLMNCILTLSKYLFAKIRKGRQFVPKPSISSSTNNFKKLFWRYRK